MSSLNLNNIKKIQKNIELCLYEDILFLVKNDKNICKIIVTQNKLDLYFMIENMEHVNLNMTYESIVNGQIHIELLDNVYDDILYEMIDKRINIIK